MSLPSLAELFKEACEKYASNPALTMRIRYRMHAWTYRDLFRYAAGIAEALEAHGIKKGDHVLLWGQNSPYWVAAYFGTLLKGAIVVPIHKENTAEFIEKVARQTNAKIIFHQIGLVPPKADMVPILLEETEPADEVPEIELSAEDDAILMYTSGTTGIPKGVMLTHGNLASNLFALSQMAREERLFTEGARYLSILPLSHIFEQTVGMLFPLWSGGHVIYAPNLASSTILSLLREYKINRLMVVPEFLARIIRRIEEKGGIHFYTIPFIKKRFGGHLEWVACGGAALDPEIEKKWARLGIDLLQGYGLTETSPIISMNTPAKRRIGSVGKPIYDVWVKIAEDGEILVKGHSVFRGYFKNAEKTEESFDESGWFHTGDVARMDEEGYFVIVDRKKDQINTAGFKVWPREVEEVIYAHPAVKIVAVIGAEDSYRGEVVKACVVLKEEQRGRVSEAEIVSFCKERLTGYKVPRIVEFRDELPVTATGKMLRRVLRANANQS